MAFDSEDGMTMHRLVCGVFCPSAEAISWEAVETLLYSAQLEEAGHWKGAFKSSAWPLVLSVSCPPFSTYSHNHNILTSLLAQNQH